MSIANSIRAQIPPIHPEGYRFIGGFALASLILFWIWTPLGWLGTATRTRAWRQAATANLGLHERVQLPCEP
jgi:hypothetical protein